MYPNEAKAQPEAPCANIGMPTRPRARYALVEMIARSGPSPAPISSTENVASEIGTGVNGSGITTFPAVHSSATAPLTSSASRTIRCAVAGRRGTRTSESTGA